MPLYEYQCGSCGERFERLQRFSDPPVKTCPTCGGVVERLISPPAIQFKGSGFYITDYAKSSKNGKDASPSGKDVGASKSSETQGGAADKPASSTSPAKTDTSPKSSGTPSK